MKKKIEFSELKRGQCFRLTKNGPIHQLDETGEYGQILIGKQAGKTTWILDDEKKVYPTKVKIVEVK